MYPGFKSLHQLEKVRKLDIVVLKKHLHGFTGLSSVDKNGNGLLPSSVPSVAAGAGRRKKSL